MIPVKREELILMTFITGGPTRVSGDVGTGAIHRKEMQ